MTNLLWILPALLLLPCVWFVASWHFQRKIDALLVQLNLARQTAADHANQARRQIGQLQAELAARPPLAPAARAERASPAAPAAESRRAEVDKSTPSHGFSATAILPHGFAQTQVME